jgi:hypothetical protein
MKAQSIVYWIATTLVACDATLAGVFYLTHAPFVMKAFAHMGYPTSSCPETRSEEMRIVQGAFA